MVGLESTGARANALLCGVLAALAGSVFAAVPDPLDAAAGSTAIAGPTAAAYARAARFVRWNAGRYLLNGNLQHHWIGSADRLWYVREGGSGPELVGVDAAANEQRVLARFGPLADAIARVSSAPVDPLELSRTVLSVGADFGTVIVGSHGHRYRCAIGNVACEPLGPAPARQPQIASPDGRWAAFRKGEDIWVRSLADGAERRLTADGVPHHGYGKFGDMFRAVRLRRLGPGLPPVVVWSPDSRRLVTLRMDERNVRDLHLTESAPASGGARPIDHVLRYWMPGDEHPVTFELVILDVERGTATPVRYQPFVNPSSTSLASRQVWWSPDGRRLFVLPDDASSSVHKQHPLLAVDAATGDTRALITEESDTFVPIEVNAVHTLDDGRLLWYSERDGWGHLYLYRADGRLQNRVTSGQWRVRQIVRVDEARRKVYFTAGGESLASNPYYRVLFVIGFDGSGLKRLTPEDADHDLTVPAPGSLDPEAPGPDRAAFSPSGRFFVETYSRPDQPPVMVLRNASGATVRELERADITRLSADGLRLPEPITVKAADGRTVLYGVVYRPSDFDPRRNYPIVDCIYPGPQRIGANVDFKGALFGFNEQQALAELGFIVLTLDARGTPLRSKAFLDHTYGRMGNAGLDDHVAAIGELAARWSYVDLDRVGIYGHSAGGFAATRGILAYPEFFKVAVASSGTHRLQGYLPGWGHTFQGPYSPELYAEADNVLLADRLKGHLLLLHGELDDNVPPALTLQVAAALIGAHKNFDVQIVPSAGHMFDGAEAWFTRKRWDFFVRHLLHAEPPSDYQLPGPP